MCTCIVRINTYTGSIHANSIIMIAHNKRKKGRKGDFKCIMCDFLLKERKKYNVNMRRRLILVGFA